MLIEKPSARNAGGLPWHSVHTSSSCRIRLCSRPWVQLKKCARACTRSDASRLRTIDSIWRKSVAALRAIIAMADGMADLQRLRCNGFAAFGGGRW